MNISPKKTLITGIALGSAIAVSTLAFAGSHGGASKDELKKAMEYRQSNFKMVKQHFNAITAVVKGKVAYDADSFAKDAKALAMLSQLSANGFVVKGTHEKSRAKKVIWEDKLDFSRKVAAFQKATASLAAAANSGDLNEAKAAFGDVGKSCKGCHTTYRSKKK